MDTVASEGLVGAADVEMMAAAQVENRMVITFDLGFGDLRLHPLGSRARVVLLRHENQRPAMVTTVLQNLVEHHDLDALVGCLVVVTETLIRIRRNDERCIGVTSRSSRHGRHDSQVQTSVPYESTSCTGVYGRSASSWLAVPTLRVNVRVRPSVRPGGIT